MGLAMSFSIPIRLLHAAVGHKLTVELTTGDVYQGDLLLAEDNINLHLFNTKHLSRDGKGEQLDQVYVRGSHIRFLVLPDLIQFDPVLERQGKGQKGPLTGPTEALRAKRKPESSRAITGGRRRA